MYVAVTKINDDDEKRLVNKIWCTLSACMFIFYLVRFSIDSVTLKRDVKLPTNQPARLSACTFSLFPLTNVCPLPLDSSP